jgi:hypothetical protein
MKGEKPTALGGDDALDKKQNGGVYTRHPAAQLKYNTSWERGTETQARLYLQVPGKDAIETANLYDQPTKEYAFTAASIGYIDFLLQSVRESYAEKVQVAELLGDTYAGYFLGQRAPVFQYSGILLSTQQDDWWQAFTYLYKDSLRGSKLAAHGALMHLRYDTRLITGALTDFSTSLSSDMQMSVQFSFSMLVKNVELLPSSAPNPTQKDGAPVSLDKLFTPTELRYDTGVGGVMRDAVILRINSGDVKPQEKLYTDALPPNQDKVPPVNIPDFAALFPYRG